MGIFGNPVVSPTGLGSSAARRHGSYTSTDGEGSADQSTTSSRFDRSATEKNWDATLNTLESDTFNYAVTGGAIAGAAMIGGAAAAAPVAVATAAGMAGGYVGALAGDWLGNHIMPLLGFERMAEDGEMPATVDHPIAHTSTWATLGAMVLGAVAAVGAAVFVVATFGAGLAVLAVAALAAGALAGLGAGFASAAGQYGTNKGLIILGSTDVYFEGKSVARRGDIIECSRHGEQAVAEGCETVFANNRPIARIGHKSTCDGVINDGCATIAIDIDTGAGSLDIDGGWTKRWLRTGLAVMNFLPIPRGGRRGRSSRTDIAPPARSTSQGRRGKAPAHCQTCRKDPVDVASGTLTDIRTDIHIPGTINMNLTRSYCADATGIQGVGWASTWSQHLHIVDDTMVYQDPEGALITFHTPHDSIMAEHLVFPHLELLGQKRAEIYLLNRREQLFYVFNHRRGDRILLSRIEDRNGNGIDFKYGEDGLSEVAHSDGFVLDVDSSDMLIRRATFRDHEHGDCNFVWNYTTEGWLEASYSAQTGALFYSYDAKGRIVRWADTAATEVFYSYDTNGRVSRTWTNSGHMNGRFSYDLKNRVTTLIEQDGTTSQYFYNDDGVVYRELDANGAEWLTEWDGQFNILSQTDPLGHQTSYTYDEYGNLTSATDADGSASSWTYNDDGLLDTEVDPEGFTRKYAYDAQGNLTGIVDAEGNLTSFRLSPEGQVLRVDLPGGAQERIYYDKYRRPRLQRTMADHERHMQYDIEGRLTWVQDEIGATTRYDMRRDKENPRGSVRSVILPDETEAKYTWDSEGQISSQTDAEGNTQHFSFGAFDLPISTTDPHGHSLTLEHDSELRLSAVVNQKGERYEYRYDPTGALISETDFAGLTTRYDRDAAGRVVAKTAPDGTRSTFTYSARGDLIEARTETRDGTAVTTYAYDARGLMVLAENADAKVEYEYDAFGRVVLERVDGREIKSAYGTGPTGRLERSGDVLPISTAYSKAGLPTELKIGHHDPLRFNHDKRGYEILRETDQGFALAQSYDRMGMLKTQLAGPRDHLPDDALRGKLGVSGSYHEEMAKRRLRTHRSYDWDKIGRAVGLNDTHWGNTRMQYDARGQVAATQRSDPYGMDKGHTQFDYDPCRNLSYVETPKKHDLVKQSPGGRVHKRGNVYYRHDDCGRVIEKRVEEHGFRPKIWRMSWNGEDRLIRLETPDGAVWRYAYDALGRRVRRLKLVAGSAERPNAPGHIPAGQGRAYQWDGDQIVSDAPVYADGTIAWDKAEAWVYEPHSFRPIAKLAGDDLYYVVTDHLGTPRELISEDGATTTWRARIGLWGAVEDKEFRAANDDTPPVTCNIRFQGQWFDEESGLHYNRFRYYDPQATQYLSPDPIGLAGGVRPQGYVADPNGWVDPLGLAGCQPTWDPRSKRWRDSNGRFAKEPTPAPIANPKRLENHRDQHIINRHAWAAPRKKGKTHFPKSWSNDRIIHNVQDVKDNPTSVTKGIYGQNVYYGQRDGVNITVDDYPANSKYPGTISTAYPVQ
ncbi:RHS repeat-associated core domain-containing protein [Marivita sp. S0852]|uniref:RHS repeat-associated core domain-containing protein n=1 Tax=Marivita sp. S0852 TaxID=3373893 RepID=UPI003982D652